MTGRLLQPVMSATGLKYDTVLDCTRLYLFSALRYSNSIINNYAYNDFFGSFNLLFKNKSKVYSNRLI